MSRYHFFNSYHGQEVKGYTKQVTSNIPLPKIKPKEGQLYFRYAPSSRNGPKIGEYKKGSLVDGYNTPTVENYLIPIDKDDVEIYIITSDGKQKHSDLVDNNIGDTFPLVNISSHKKYKYQIEIKNQIVSLSAENVLFIHKNFKYKKLNHNNLYSYYGILGYLTSDIRNILEQIYYVGFQTIDGNYHFYVPVGLLEENNNYYDINITPIQKDELVDKGINFNRLHSRTVAVQGVSSVNGIFDTVFFIEQKGRISHYSSYICEEKTFNKIKEIFGDRYLYKNKSFILNPKYNSLCINEKRNTSSRGRRGTSRSFGQNENIFFDRLPNNG